MKQTHNYWMYLIGLLCDIFLKPNFSLFPTSVSNYLEELHYKIIFVLKPEDQYVGFEYHQSEKLRRATYTAAVCKFWGEHFLVWYSSSAQSFII